jgi:hypothetical protein
MTTAERIKLPNRRPSVTTPLPFDGQTLSAMVGFDRHDAPRELFLSGAKDGSGLAAILADASVVISIALQYGVPPAELAHSVTRVPLSYSDTDNAPSVAASVIGAAVDLIVQYAAENEEYAHDRG